MSKDGKTKDIFFGIVAIATLIVAIIGATLAYFSITASSNEGAINAQAATVSIVYNDGQQVTAQADQLIPADFEGVVKPVYEEKFMHTWEGGEIPENNLANICTDSNDKQVCSVYRFSVSSEIERTITATLNNESNGFQYLHYALYDVTAQEWFEISDGMEYNSINKCNNESEVEEEKCFNATDGEKTYLDTARNSIFGKTLVDGIPVNKGVPITSERVFDLILFIRETDTNQNIDQGKQYRGTIIVDVSTTDKNGIISGCVGDEC